MGSANTSLWAQALPTVLSSIVSAETANTRLTTTACASTLTRVLMYDQAQKCCVCLCVSASLPLACLRANVCFVIICTPVGVLLPAVENGPPVSPTVSPACG